MSLSTICEPMKPAPPVTRIRMLAWIKQQIGTDNQDPEHAQEATRRGEIRATGSRCALTWKNLEKRSGEGVGGGRVVCSPLLPLVSFCAIAGHAPGPPRSNPSHPSAGEGKKITHRDENETRRQDETITELLCKQRSVRGGGDSPSRWRRRGLGSARVAWLADTAV
jgi:hypothetical protein